MLLIKLEWYKCTYTVFCRLNNIYEEIWRMFVLLLLFSLALVLTES